MGCNQLGNQLNMYVARQVAKGWAIRQGKGQTKDGQNNRWVRDK